MKVVIIGSGGQGTGLASLLTLEKDITSLVLADYSENALEAAKTSIELLENRLVQDIQYITVNAADVEDVRRVSQGASVIFNGTVPKFNYPIMKAALAEKTHYIDLFGAPFEDEGVSYEETLTAQFDLNEAFKDAGILGVPSLGASPGWTTLVALKSIEELDEVSEVIIRFYYYADTDKFYFPVAPTIILGEWLGAPSPLRTVNGVAETVDLLESKEIFDFLPPFGKREVYTVPTSPNIFIIPQLADKPVGLVVEKSGIGVGKLETFDIIVKALQKVTSKQGWGKEEINIIEKMAEDVILPFEFLNLLKAGEIRFEGSSVTIEVAGKKDGKDKRKISYCNSDFSLTSKYLPWSSPGVFATIGGLTIETVLGLVRGEIKDKGVLPVSSLALRDELLERMKKRGFVIQEVEID